MASVLLIGSQETSSILPYQSEGCSQSQALSGYSLWPKKLLILFFIGAQIHVEGGVTHRSVVKLAFKKDRRYGKGAINAPRQSSGPRIATLGHFC